jgi:cold shock protein
LVISYDPELAVEPGFGSIFLRYFVIGYGLIQPDTGSKDDFVHISAVQKSGLSGLPDGANLTFDIVPNRGKESAENLRLMVHD